VRRRRTSTTDLFITSAHDRLVYNSRSRQTCLLLLLLSVTAVRPLTLSKYLSIATYLAY